MPLHILSKTRDHFQKIKLFKMKMNFSASAFVLTAFLLVLSAACKKESRSDSTERKLVSAKNPRSNVTTDAASPTSESNGRTTEAALLQAIKQATSRFHATTQAIKAGYLPDEHCVAAPGLGGMGFHWVNPALVDPVFDPLQPEAVLYAPGPGGQLRLIGLEYIVINTGQPAPQFGTQPFDVGGTPIQAPHWSLHLWLYEPNPSGLFAPFNPNVSCP
jgi:hypothetical protein